MLGSAQRLALLLACIGMAAAYSQREGTAQVLSLLEDRPAGSRVLFTRSPYQAFDRRLPLTIEASLLTDFEAYFNVTQDFHAQGPNTYVPSGRAFVAEIDGGCVRGILGDVYNSKGQAFSELISPGVPPAAFESPLGCKRFDRLASPVQRYGHMYFHFMQEVLPRIVLLGPLLRADRSTKLLMFGAPYELEWLRALGVDEEQVEVYDPSQCYCADTLVVPAASPTMMPPRENYQLVRSALLPKEKGVALRDSGDQDVILYCSRQGSSDRQVSNEAELLAAIAEQHPSATLLVYKGTEPVDATIRMFQRATVVVGMHGAGLSHIVFSDPTTVVVELLFMSAPPLMFWHAASALGQRYVMVPLAQSWWLQPSVEVAVQDVLDAIALAVGASSDCPDGFSFNSAAKACAPCPPGSYSARGSDRCLPCATGRYAAAPGSPFCRTCPTGTFSAPSATACTNCPADATTLFPGSPSDDKCLSVEQLEVEVERLYSDDALAKKLVSLPTLSALERLRQDRERGTLMGWLRATVRSSAALWANVVRGISEAQQQRRQQQRLQEQQQQLARQRKYLDELLKSDDAGDMVSTDELSAIEAVSGSEAVAVVAEGEKERKQQWQRSVDSDTKPVETPGWRRYLQDMAEGKEPSSSTGSYRRSLAAGYGSITRTSANAKRRNLAETYGSITRASTNAKRRSALSAGQAANSYAASLNKRRQLIEEVVEDEDLGEEEESEEDADAGEVAAALAQAGEVRRRQRRAVARRSLAEGEGTTTGSYRRSLAATGGYRRSLAAVGDARLSTQQNQRRGAAQQGKEGKERRRGQARKPQHAKRSRKAARRADQGA